MRGHSDSMKMHRVIEYCANCNGSGRIMHRFLFWDTEEECPYCEGRGRLSIKEIWTEREDSGELR